jgi:hypothetical protein
MANKFSRVYSWLVRNDWERVAFTGKWFHEGESDTLELD